jgi:thioredoxin reductase (NADPH)
LPTIKSNSLPEEVKGDQSGVTGIKIKNVKSPEKEREIKADGVFIFIGLDPITDLVRDLVKCDKGGYIIVDRGMRTSAEGIFACGDCIAKTLRQVITACGDGATAAHNAELYVDELKGQAY